MTHGEMIRGRAYPRTTSLDFLTRCSPRMAAFYRYWESKRRGGLLPGRADLDPVEMKPWLPGIVLVDVQRQPFRLTYRLLGTRATSLRGQEATGKTVHEAYFGDSLEEILENYRLVIDERQPVYDWDHTPSSDGFTRDAETLLLPLASDGRNVDMVIVYLEVEGG